jgi:molybdopterin molybdotransferase
MHSVAQALEIVLGQVPPLPPVTMPLGPEALGMVLAEDIVSDLDMPPFDKAMMDGFALRTSDLRDGRAELVIVEEIMAGKTPTTPIGCGQSSRIMTGAPVPQGADAVVMIERCEPVGAHVRVNGGKVTAGLNILPRGREMRVGETVLRAGVRLRPQELGVLATVGRISAKVKRAPRVAVLPTGNELVDATTKPGPGQLRNSNGPMLLAQVARAGGIPWALGIARDEPGHLRSLIEEGFQADVLLLSGGVSAGKLDLVPSALADLGAITLFHKIAMKPGKPLLFGVRYPIDSKNASLVFGLPGNPVASLVCFELFVRPAIRAMMDLPSGPEMVKATLVKDYSYATDRPTYHPARLELTGSGWTVEPVAWFGSPDLRGVTPANAFVVLPDGDHHHRAGDRLMVLRVENDW